MDALTIGMAPVGDAGVAALIARHFALMRAGSPEESCHVMSAETLERDGVRILAARDGSGVVGIAGLKPLDARHGEVKSMHVLEAVRGRGIARRLLHALIDDARQLGLDRLSLETGAADSFAPARGLYLAEGFAPCAPFGAYRPDPLSVFLTRRI